MSASDDRLNSGTYITIRDSSNPSRRVRISHANASSAAVTPTHLPKPTRDPLLPSRTRLRDLYPHLSALPQLKIARAYRRWLLAYHRGTTTRPAFRMDEIALLRLVSDFRDVEDSSGKRSLPCVSVRCSGDKLVRVWTWFGRVSVCGQVEPSAWVVLMVKRQTGVWF